MPNFYEFQDKQSLKDFFLLINKTSGLMWNEIINNENIARSLLDLYKKGTKINEENFNKLISYIPKNQKKRFLEKTIIVDSKEWLKKGGHSAYKKNKDKFRIGRKKGIFKIKEKARISNNKIKEEVDDLEITEEICEFVGAFIGDGFFNCYNNKLYQIEFAGDSRYDLDYYQKVIIPIVKSLIKDINPHIYYVKNTNSLRVVFYSKRLFEILKQKFGFIPGRKTHTVKIPQIIMRSKTNFINATIRGIFNTDGGIFLDKRGGYKMPYPRIIFTTVSEPLYVQLKNYLSKEFKMYNRKNKNRLSYYIEIYGFHQLRKWMSKIGFSNPRHFNKVPL